MINRALAMLILSATIAQAEESVEKFPSREVTLVVPYQAGGTTDIIGRILSEKLSEKWGKNIIIENRPGGNGLIALSHVARSKPDGHTMLAVASSRLVLSSATSRKQVDVDREFAPISRIGYVPNVLVVHPSVQANSVAELVALAKAKPGSLSFGSQSIGSNGHLTGELFQQQTGTKMLHVPYKGSAPAVRDLLGGHIDMLFDNLPVVLSAIKSGKLKALAVTTEERSKALPDVPTLSESGLSGFNTSAWFAIIVPKAVPSVTRSSIEKAIVDALHSADVKEKLKIAGVDSVDGGSEKLIKRIGSESKMWADVLKKANIELK